MPVLGHNNGRNAGAGRNLAFSFALELSNDPRHKERLNEKTCRRLLTTQQEMPAGEVPLTCPDGYIDVHGPHDKVFATLDLKTGYW